MGADISVEAVAGKLNRVGYESFIQALAAGQERRQPQRRARPLAPASPAEGPHRPRAHRRSFQAEPRQTAGRCDRGRQRLPQERNRDARHLEPGRRRARPRLALCDAAVWRDADPHRPPPGGDAEVDRAEARADRRLAGIRQDPGRRGRRQPARDLGRIGRRQPAPDGRLGRRGGGRGRHDRRARRQGHDRARPVQPGPHRQGEGRRDGPDPRPRRRDPPDRRRPHAPAAEQSDPHRRSGRRQDGGRRGLRAAHRLGRRSAAAARRQALRARRRPHAGGRLDEGRVRAAAALGHRRGAVLADADHPVHRRGAYADRRRRRRRARATRPTC